MKRTLAILIITLVMAGCSYFRGSNKDIGPKQSRTNVQTQPSPRYFDFDDILVPRQMELVPEKSLLFETPGVKAGLLVFEGRVEPVSLFDFFITNMPKDNWQLRSYFKYGRYILVFEKPDRDCVVSLEEKALSTDLQIWVAPRYSGTLDQPGETILTR